MLLQNDDPHTPPEIEKFSKSTQEKLKDFRKNFLYSYTILFIFQQSIDFLAFILFMQQRAVVYFCTRKKIPKIRIHWS